MHKTDKPFVIAIFGPAGVGKSTLAELLKNEISYTAHVSSDHIKRYISEFKEIPSHNKVSRNVTNAMIAEYLKNGINVIVDQGMDKEEIETLKKIADAHDASFFVYGIEAEDAIQIERLKERAERINQPVMSEETIDTLSRIYKGNDYNVNTTFDAGTLSTREIADLILKDLKLI
jgi:dephospho-CoA kinase